MEVMQLERLWDILKNMQKTDRYIFHSSKASFSAQ